MFKTKKRETSMTVRRQFDCYDVTSVEYTPEARAFEPNPQKTPLDLESLQEEIMRRYSKTIDYLAK